MGSYGKIQNVFHKMINSGENCDSSNQQEIYQNPEVLLISSEKFKRLRS